MFQRYSARRKCKKNNLPKFVCDYVLSFDKVNYQQKIENTKFIIFDTETTGLDLKKDSVICIGALVMDQMKILIHNSLEIYIKNPVAGDHESIPIHQILAHELEKGMEETEALEVFLDYIKNNILVAHCAYFDIQMMSRLMQKHFQIPLLNKYIDTIYLAKRIEKGVFARDVSLPNEYTFDNLCQRYNIEIINRHNAAGDALGTARLFQLLLSKGREKGIHTLKQLI